MQHLTDDQIWDAVGVIADGEWTITDLWDHARLLGVRPSDLFPDRYQPSLETGAAGLESRLGFFYDPLEVAAEELAEPDGVRDPECRRPVQPALKCRRRLAERSG